MNRSICGVQFALGIPLVLALAVTPASADEQRPHRQGKQRQSQECEPRAPKGRAQVQRKRVRAVAQRKAPAAAQPPPEQARPPEQPPEQPREIERKKEPPPEQMREPEQPPEQGRQPVPQPMREPEQPPEQGLEPESSCVYEGLEPSVINERALCSTLSDKAYLQFEEIAGGAAIVLSPKPGYTLRDLRWSIDDLELAVEKQRNLSPPAVQQRCALFDLYRRTGDLPKVMEGRNMMRLHFTTSKADQVMPLRTEAYQFACTPTL